MTDLPPPVPPGPSWGPPPAPPVGAPPPAPYGGVAYGGAPVTRTESTAVASLVLGIVSFVVCPVVIAVVALALGYAARNRIERSGGALRGLGLARAGRVLAWVNIALATVLVWLVGFALAGS